MSSHLSTIPTAEEWQQTLADRHGPALQAKFSTSAVAVCGLGGLGSHIASTLARAGVGHLILIDFDRVDLTNLHRQQYTADQIGQAKTQALADSLRAINPYIKLTLHSTRLTEDNLLPLLQDADIICEAFDQAEAKAMLVNGVLELLPDKYLVAASGMAGLGPANRITTRHITNHFYLCGDGTSDIAEGISLFAPRAMLCAAHQALAVLRILAGETDV